MDLEELILEEESARERVKVVEELLTKKNDNFLKLKKKIAATSSLVSLNRILRDDCSKLKISNHDMAIKNNDFIKSQKEYLLNQFSNEKEMNALQCSYDGLTEKYNTVVDESNAKAATIVQLKNLAEDGRDKLGALYIESEMVKSKHKEELDHLRSHIKCLKNNQRKKSKAFQTKLHRIFNCATALKRELKSKYCIKQSFYLKEIFKELKNLQAVKYEESLDDVVVQDITDDYVPFNSPASADTGKGSSICISDDDKSSSVARTPTRDECVSIDGITLLSDIFAKHPCNESGNSDRSATHAHQAHLPPDNSSVPTLSSSSSIMNCLDKATTTGDLWLDDLRPAHVYNTIHSEVFIGQNDTSQTYDEYVNSILKEITKPLPALSPLPSDGPDSSNNNKPLGPHTQHLPRIRKRKPLNRKHLLYLIRRLVKEEIGNVRTSQQKIRKRQVSKHMKMMLNKQAHLGFTKVLHTKLVCNGENKETARNKLYTSSTRTKKVDSYRSELRCRTMKKGTIENKSDKASAKKKVEPILDSNCDAISLDRNRMEVLNVQSNLTVNSTKGQRSSGPNKNSFSPIKVTGSVKKQTGKKSNKKQFAHGVIGDSKKEHVIVCPVSSMKNINNDNCLKGVDTITNNAMAVDQIAVTPNNINNDNCLKGVDTITNNAMAVDQIAVTPNNINNDNCLKGVDTITNNAMAVDQIAVTPNNINNDNCLKGVDTITNNAMAVDQIAVTPNNINNDNCLKGVDTITNNAMAVDQIAVTPNNINNDNCLKGVDTITNNAMAVDQIAVTPNNINNDNCLKGVDTITNNAMAVDQIAVTPNNVKKPPCITLVRVDFEKEHEAKRGKAVETLLKYNLRSNIKGEKSFIKLRKGCTIKSLPNELIPLKDDCNKNNYQNRITKRKSSCTPTNNKSKREISDDFHDVNDDNTSRVETFTHLEYNINPLVLVVQDVDKEQDSVKHVALQNCRSVGVTTKADSIEPYKNYVKRANQTIYRVLEREVLQNQLPPNRTSHFAPPMKLVAEVETFLKTSFTIDALKDFVNSLKKEREEDIAYAVTEFLCSMKEKYSDDNLSCHVILPMTKSQMATLVLIKRLLSSKSNIVKLLLKRIEFKMFKLNNTPQYITLHNLTHIYVAICKTHRLEDKLKLFCFDALYCLSYSAGLIVYIVLHLWPEFFPKSHVCSDPLITTLVHHILSNFSTREHYHSRSLQQMLFSKYGYRSGEYTDNDILAILSKALKETATNRNKTLMYAFILFGKKTGVHWCYENIIVRTLIPAIEDPQSSTFSKSVAIALIGALTRPFAGNRTIPCAALQTRSWFQVSNNPCIDEAVLSCFYHFKKKSCSFFNKLTKWQPPYPVTEEICDLLKSIIIQRHKKSFPVYH